MVQLSGAGQFLCAGERDGLHQTLVFSRVEHPATLDDFPKPYFLACAKQAMTAAGKFLDRQLWAEEPESETRAGNGNGIGLEN